MKLNFKQMLLVSAAVGLSGCSKDVSQEVAECESAAYAQIGAKSDAQADLSYLDTKGELVRVCMVSKGFKFKPAAYDKEIHRLANTYAVPGEFYGSEEQKRFTADLLTNSNLWERR